MSLSLVVITKNEEDCIERCLRSVPFAAELIVVDSGSTDRTVEICKALGAQVFVTADYPGNGPQKNRALDKATSEWVLSLDADEWLTPELADEIRQLVQRNPSEVAAYRVRRLSSFCGRFMHHSGWWPDWIVRLVRRGNGRFNDELAHDRMIVNGEIGELRGTLMHESITDLDDMLHKMNRYSSAGASMVARRGRSGSLAKAITHGVWAFLRTYLLRRGFLDGREGFMVAVYAAENSYYKYAKLMVMGRPKRELR